MPTMPKRVVNGYPLTEHHSHQYECQDVLFVKRTFWQGIAPSGAHTGPYFTLTDAVTDAASRQWIFPVETCTTCGGHGYQRVPGTFNLAQCERCQGEGMDPVQPLLTLDGVL